ncbi:NFAT activation molecule 1 [Synchiropus picturatus]
MSLCRSLRLTFMFSFPALWCGIKAQELSLLSRRVSVAFTGENQLIEYQAKKPANCSQTVLRCFDPLGQPFYEHPVSPTVSPFSWKDTVIVKNPSHSGEYYCEHQAARVYWFLRLRDSGYGETTQNSSECIILATTFVVLLVVSVVGSWYVFRCSWERTCGSRPKGVNRRRVVEDNNDRAAPSSVYASLDPHTQSIYAVLDRTSVASEPDQKQSAPRSKKSHKTVSPDVHGEGAFESVYENF